MNLNEDNITFGIDGGKWKITNRQKTHNKVKIPLLPIAEVLILKHEGHIKTKKTKTLFPSISNQKLNSYLKEITDLCKIKKNLTFHIARHTFATTITLFKWRTDRYSFKITRSYQNCNYSNLCKGYRKESE